MKNTFALAAATLALGLSTASVVLAQPTTPGIPGRPVVGRAHKERHPELRRALKALTRARTDLQNGSHDFSGHREKALDLTQRAIAEVNQALQSDTR